MRKSSVRSSERAGLIEQIRQARDQNVKQEREEALAALQAAAEPLKRARAAAGMDDEGVSTQVVHDWTDAWLRDNPAVTLQLEEARERYAELLTDEAADAKSYAQRTAQRRKMLKRSRKNAIARTSETDSLAAFEARSKVTKIEWSDELAPGSMVMTDKGDIGLVLRTRQERATWARSDRNKDRAVAWETVTLLVNGTEETHFKLSVRPIDWI